MQYRVPKGVFDILPYGEDLSWRHIGHWQYLEAVIREIAKDYCCQEVRTPIFEQTELFCRGVGATSDIAAKELYTFLDKGGRSMSLRPEGTASIMRCFIEKNLHSDRKTHKFFYIGPMFRYDRPQAGRYRQHHQFGVEAIGSSAIEQDAEIIDLLMEFYRRLGIKNALLKLNFLGDSATRTAYKEALEKYLKPHFSSLSPDSQNRFDKNILRILDSKAPQDAALLQKAPVILDFLDENSSAQFKALCRHLDLLKINYVIDPFLVRGLDYYDKTVFEVVAGKTGAQNSLGGGGRYDSLIKSLGGPDLPGIGFATGLERVLQAMLDDGAAIPSLSCPLAFLIPLGAESQNIVFEIAAKLRHAGISTDVCYGESKPGTGLKEASKKEARFAVIIGENELPTKMAVVKDLASREQQEIAFDLLPDFFQRRKDAFTD